MKFSKRIRNVLFRFDQFGIPVNLLMKKEPMYNTHIGSVISVGILLFTFISFVSLIQEVAQGASPSVISNVQFDADPDLFVLTPDNFRVSLAISGIDGIIIQNTMAKSYYRVKVKFIEQRSGAATNNLSNSKITNSSYMIPCGFTDNNQLVKELKIDNTNDFIGYCIDDVWWQGNPLRMQGTAWNRLYDYLFLTLETCKNSTDPNDRNAPICAPEEEIKAKLAAGIVAFNFVDQLLDQSKSEPFEPIYKSMILRFNLLGNMKNILFYLRHTVMSSLFNPFYYGGTTKEDHVLQYARHEQTSDYNVVNGQFMAIHFTLDDQTVSYSRTYKNILEVLGQVIGLFGTMKAVFSFLIIPLCEKMMNMAIIESIFSFQNEPHPTAKKTVTFEKKETMKNSLKLVTSQKVTSMRSLQGEGDPIKKFLKFKDRNLKFQGFTDYIKSFFWGAQNRQINLGVEQCQEKLDVVFIIRKLIDIDKLKTLLLTSDQLKLFDFIPKPLIKQPLATNKVSVHPENSEMQKIDYITEQKPFEDYVQDALNAYQKITMNQNLKEMDSKLIDMMDIEIRQVFQEVMKGSHYQNKMYLKATQMDESKILASQPLKSNMDQIEQQLEEEGNFFSQREIGPDI